MARFLLRRLLFALLLVVTVSSSALLLTRLAPGDVTTELGPRARPEEIARTRERFDLDRSPVAQLGGWALRAVRFDFGDSFLYNRPVGGLIRRAAGNTAVLAVAALAIATLAGIPLGIVTGSRRGALAGAIRTVSLVCLSIPPLLTSLLLLFIAARTGWLPTGGMTSVEAVDAGWSAWMLDVARHLPLPALALALPLAATFERLQSQAMTETIHQPFVVAALARGVTWRQLLLDHAWRVSLRSMCAIYGLAIGALLSGSFVVEYVTAWPGLGRLMYEALRARDIYLVAGCAAMGGVFLAFGSLVSDLLLFAADPRVREGQTT
ncbi:MAG TPA: ABC transporter permease [Vicinamibacterales bacterium]